MATWTVGAARDLPIVERDSWDGPAATASVFEWAGWPDNPDSTRARRAFLLYDSDAPELRGSYKLPFAVVTGGRLVASRAGLRAAASRLPQTDAPQEVLDRARSVIDAYYKRMEEAELDTVFMEMKTIEYKTIIEPRVINERTVTGYPSIFGNVDDGGDLIEPGAYQKTIADRGHRIRWLWQHNHADPPTAKILNIAEVGRDDLPAEVLERFPTAKGGLRVQREYLDTPRGNEVLLAIKSGALNELSLGYDAIKSEYPGEYGGRKVRRVLKEMRLWEFSDVLWGMNAATTNTKSIDLDAPLEEIIALLKEAGRMDELAALLQPPAPPEPVVIMADMRAIAERKRRLEVTLRQLAL